MADNLHFLPKTTGQISAPAFDKLKSLASTIGPQWIAGFYYYSNSQVRLSKDAGWIDQGAGIGLGGFKRADIPSGYEHQREGIDYIIQIPPNIWASAKLGIIDIDPSMGKKFIII